MLPGLCVQVVDATWEPVEVPVPAHRHIVPLTFEQVKAQLPPDKPWPQKWLEVAEARAHRPKPSVWVEDFVAAAAATFDPLIAAAIAADSGGPADRGVGPSSSSGGIASSADEPGRAAFWSEVSPRLSVLDCLPTHPRDKFMFDPSACDSAQLQQIAERFRPLVQAKGPSSAGSVGDCIRQLLTPQYSSSDYYSSPRVSFGSRWSGAWGSSDSEDEDLDVERVDGCDTYWSDIFGPALTCLTANQAVNMPQVRAALLPSRHVGWCTCIRCIVKTVTSRMRAVQVAAARKLAAPACIGHCAVACAASNTAVSNGCCKESASIPVCCCRCLLQGKCGHTTITQPLLVHDTVRCALLLHLCRRAAPLPQSPCCCLRVPGILS